MAKIQVSISLRAGGSCVDIKPLFSFDSKFFFISSGWEIKVISTASGECVRRLRGHKSKVVSFHQNPINKVQIISCSEDGTVIFWDYVDGISLKTMRTTRTAVPVISMYITERNQYFVLTLDSNLCYSKLYSCKIDETINSKGIKCEADVIFHEVQPHPKAVAISTNGRYAVAISENFLFVNNFKEKKKLKHAGTVNFTCVSCHPQDWFVATGDALGRIIIWGNIENSSKPTRSIYHWHTLPVADLAFSYEGNYLYSGGGESVLVKWNLQVETKSFLPRLGLPISQVSIAPDNSFVVTGHEDNAICLISPQNQVVQCYQGLCQGHPWKDLLDDKHSSVIKNPVPTGLLYDTQSKALVLNGKPGHVQFYSLSHDKQLFSLDISGQNFVTRERERVIANTVVEKVALDAQSTWMATIQCRDDKETSIEIVLKFWKWNGKAQTYSLNTTVLLPHNQKVNSLLFQPHENENPMVVTTSNDGKFKIWTLDENENLAADKEHRSFWQCVTMGYYRSLPAGDADFCEDGSILAVTFKHAATLWVPDTAGLKGILTVPANDEIDNNDLLQIKFGQQNCSHLLVTSTQSKLTVWNVISLAIQWQVNMNVTFLMKNPQNEIMVVFDNEGTLYAFKPDNSKPVYIHRNSTKQPVIACTFVPRLDYIKQPDNFEDDVPTSFLNTHSLCFLNTKQELMMMNLKTEKNATDEEFNNVSNDFPRTQFGALVAEMKKNEVVQVKTEHHTYQKGNDANKAFQELLTIPSHALPSVSSLCLSFMTSLLVER